jgi:hypothetical protein
MHCFVCGTQVQQSVAVCPSCGKPIKAATPESREAPFAHNVQVLGVFWFWVSVLRMVPGLVLVSVFSLSLFPQLLTPLANTVMTVIGLVFLAGGTFGLVVSWGLMKHRPWARMLAIVVGALSLVEVPFGTIVGGYTLWFMLLSESGRQYSKMSTSA